MKIAFADKAGGSGESSALQTGNFSFGTSPSSHLEA